MLKVILSGCCGHMGRVVTDMIKTEPDMEIVAGVDIAEDASLSYPVYTDLADCAEEADVVIDFSTAAAIDGLLAGCELKKLPVVLCTTGLSDAQLEKLQQVSTMVPVLRSANMSLGINLLMKLVQDAARALYGADFDIEIVEQHHRRKLDAPSGTALALADSINDALDHACHYTFDRSQRHEKRDPEEIGISAVRGGSIVGEHDVIFAGEDEVVRISHSAYSRSIFAKGAISAAKFLAGQKAGMYSMGDVIGGM